MDLRAVMTVAVAHVVCARSGRSVLPESALPRVYPVVLERPVVMMVVVAHAVPARSVKAA